MHNSFSGKAAQRTFQTRNEIHRHFAIVGRTIRRLVKLLAFVLLLGGSFKIDISTRILGFLEGYKANFPSSN